VLINDFLQVRMLQEMVDIVIHSASEQSTLGEDAVLP
jgi:hypothetical protein